MNRILVPFTNKYPQFELFGFMDWGCHMKNNNNEYKSTRTIRCRIQVKVPRILITSRYEEGNLVIYRFDCKNLTKYNKPSYSLVSCIFSVKYSVFASKEVVDRKTIDAIDDGLKIVSTLV